MGKNKKWMPQESAHLAEAWMVASEERGEPNLKGTGQTQESFWGTVTKHLKEFAPPIAAGTHHERGMGPLKTHWSEGIARDCKKFNKCLLKIYACQPTGCTEANKISMAAAIHMGCSDTMHYRHKEYDPNAWRFCGSWCVLKEHRAFRPPSQQQASEIENIDDEENNDVAATDSSAPTSDGGVETPMQGRELFNSTPSSTAATATAGVGRHSRGGPGKTSTKNSAAVDQCRKRKQEQLQEILEIQKEHRDDFNQFLHNQSRVQAFGMAKDMLSHHMSIGDHAKVEEYRTKMENIMSFNTDGDGNEGSLEGMPPLPTGLSD